MTIQRLLRRYPPGQALRFRQIIKYNVLTNYTPNFDKFEFYPKTADTAVEDTDTFQITAASSEDGIVTADKTKVEKGGTVRLTFTPGRECFSDKGDGKRQEYSGAIKSGRRRLRAYQRAGGYYGQRLF